MNTDGHGRGTGEGTGEGIIPKHGGYRNTKTWQLADLIYDVTVRFCDKFVDRRSRTHDQMVQAARSGCQNLQEGSVDSATSKKLELKLTGTARGSLMELQRDYQKFLQHRGLPEWPPDHPALVRFRALRCNTLEKFRAWVAEETRRYEQEHTDEHGEEEHGQKHGQTRAEARADVRAGPCAPVSLRDFPAVCAANGALALLNLCIHLVGRQLEAQAAAFEREGGFTERLYRRRQAARRQHP
ncbi:MAG: four helix bundle suffix domain-containing protein [Bryobacteraceae bacterium]|nr:four helix bundle suffix domain-containing protein [Bryobacteraceae bacterium]